jgi:hypothetical protein
VAREEVARATAAQQAKIDDWNARDAEDRAAGGPGLNGRTRPKSPAAGYVRVREAQAQLGQARERETARAAKADQERPRSRNITDPGSRLTAAGSTANSGGCQCGTCGTCLIALFLADSGYLSEHDLTCPGPDRLIATGKTRDLEKNTRNPDSPKPSRYAGPATAAMAERLQTSDGITACRQRGHIAETPHGNIKHNLGIRQFTLRGKTKVTAEWNLITAVHNLLKAISTGNLTTQTLTTL